MTLDGLADRGATNRATPNRGTPSTVPRSVPEQSVFQEARSAPLSPRSGPTPGIILTVEDTAREVINVSQQPGSSSSRSSWRPMQPAGPRSPRGSRMRRNASNSKLREPHNGHGGAGVSRSQSMRTARRPQSLDPSHRFRQRIASIPNDMILPGEPEDSQRVASNQSLPLPGDEAEVLRLRNFAVTPKGVVNRGDSFRSKSRSAHSVASTGSNQLAVGAAMMTPNDDSEPDGDSNAASSSVASASAASASAMVPEATPDTPPEAAAVENVGVKYRVLVLGAPDVGKTALTRQFMTSEYICAYDNSQDEENEKAVTVVLNGEESELVFMEHTFVGDTSANLAALYSPDAYLVVYSVTNKRSLQVAKDIVRLIQRVDNVDTKAVILVGNKTDLARLRMLTTDDGRSLAMEESCKFIETSAGINHHVDELLVGILSQIRLKLSTVERILRKRESVSLGKVRGRCSGCPGCKAKGIIKRILKKACSRSKSCDNLHVL